MIRQSVSAVIPVYNEEHTVGGVVDALYRSGVVSEILCVNDGSSDGSAAVLQKLGKKIVFLNFRQNRGKGYAVAAGIRRARGELVLLCDADMTNFTPDHVRKMLDPIFKGEARAVFAVPCYDRTGRYHRNEVYLAGERVYPRAALLPHLAKLSRTKGAGGSEVVLNTLFNKKDIKIVPLVGLIKPSKDQKWRSRTALKQYFHSMVGVLQEIGRIEINSAADLEKLENLIQVDVSGDLLLKIREIKDKQLRALVEKYFLKYVRKLLE